METVANIALQQFFWSLLQEKINFSRSKDMKYSNAYNVLPVDIVRMIQEYVNGEYLYIPRKEEQQKKWGENSGSRDALKRRNEEIYQKYLKGAVILDLAQEYYLSDKSIRRIISQQKKIMLNINTE
ncbi:CD3324 family protein [Anaerosolibacter carboniphilus]